METQHRPSTLAIIAYSICLLLRAVVTVIYRISTSKAFGDGLAMCGAMLALTSGWFWYLSGKGALEPNPTATLIKVNNLFNYWAGGLSAASAACVALALLLRRA